MNQKSCKAQEGGNFMNLFVANLAKAVKSKDLKTAFEHFGAVTSARVVIHKPSGQSKGYGFVEMPDDREAEAAMQALNGHLLKGKAIVIKEALPRSKKQKDGDGKADHNKPDDLRIW
jgi:RNA recognition motif-containing protein